MKHVFIINPHAGTKQSYTELKQNLIPFIDKVEIYETKNPKDATIFVKEYLNANTDCHVRFYSCGGDGTLSEVVNGVVGYPNASICVYPSGSGNDFVKSVGGETLFKDINKLLSAENKEIDLIKITNSDLGTIYSVNLTNCGFDAVVAKKANEIKDNGGRHSYTRGLIYALFKAMKNNVYVEVNGNLLNTTGKMLLCSFGNGGWYGGKYFCAPNYILDDNKMEVCLVHPVSVFTFLKLVKKYTDGKHLKDESFKKFISYTRAEKVKLYSDSPFAISVDGEIISGKEFSLEILPKALKFAIPQVED